MKHLKLKHSKFVNINSHNIFVTATIMREYQVYNPNGVPFQRISNQHQYHTNL